MQTAPPCGPADTEDYAFCIQGITSKMALNWCRWDATVIVEYSHYFCFISVQTVFSSLHSGQIEPPMAAGVPWRCFSYFPGPWQCNLLGSYCAIIFIQNILYCVPMTNKAFMGSERHGGKWKMWSMPLNETPEIVGTLIFITVNN